MEQSIGSATVVLLTYNMLSGQWMRLGSGSGPCTISILKSSSNEYRFVAWQDSNQEVVLNSFLFPSMKYDESTATFHQWYDETKAAYGLNFVDQNEAKKFGIAVSSAIEVMNEVRILKPVGDSLKPKKIIEKNVSTVSPYATTGINISCTTSIKKEPMVTIVKNSGTAPPPPPGPPPTAPSAPAPPGPPPPGPPPPGPPPIAPSSSASTLPKQNLELNDFASQLKAASLKHATTNSDASNNVTSATVKPVATQPNISSAPPMDFLSELKLRSKNRTTDNNAQLKKNDPPKVSSMAPISSSVKSTNNQPINISTSNSELSTASFVTSTDLEKFRNDLMSDILLNLEKMKNEIISGITDKLN